MDATEKSKPPFETRFYQFWLVATPKLFEWFGWIAALGATQYVYAKTKSPAVFGLLILGYFALLFYAYAIFSSKIQISSIKTKHHREFVSGLIALSLAYLTSVLAQQVVSAFSRSAL
jgi:hypothetical protein